MGRGHRLTLLLMCLVGYCYADNAASDMNRPLTGTWIDKLKKDLFANYDHSVRPAQYYNVTNLNYGLTIMHVDIDEENSILSTYGWVAMDWVDEKLKWNPDNYGQLASFRIDPDSIWKPDVVLYNNARGSDNLHYGKTNAIIYNNGTVLWVPPSDFHSFCELNLRHWPFDHQTCILKVGSWTYDGFQLNLTNKDEPTIYNLTPNKEWSIRKITTARHISYYKCCTEPYIDIQYNVTLQRHSSSHNAIVVSPAFVIMLLALSVFWLPPQSGQKIVLNGIIFLIVTAFLIYFAQQLPIVSGNLPLIVLFYSATFYLVAFSTILSVIVLRIAHTRQCRSMPRFLKSQVKGGLGSVLCVSNGGNLAEEDKEVAVGDVSIKKNDWCRLAALIDRLAFVIYLIIFVISLIYFNV